ISTTATLRDAFHRVPKFSKPTRDVVERIPTSSPKCRCSASWVVYVDSTGSHRTGGAFVDILALQRNFGTSERGLEAASTKDLQKRSWNLARLASVSLAVRRPQGRAPCEGWQIVAVGSAEKSFG